MRPCSGLQEQNVPDRAVADKLNESVVRHMRHDLACLDADQSVGDALSMIRQEPPSGRIIYFYVVDYQLRLVGVLPTRRLLLSPPEKLISEIMISSVIAIPDSATVLEACEFFTLHRLLAFPVVDASHRIIGVVDIELYTEELDDVDRQQRGDDLFQLVGVHLAQAKLGSPWSTFASRFPWLLCNIGGGLLAAALAELFAAELKRVVALALFIPVVLALAESVSIQSVSLALQTLRGQRPTMREILTKLYREMWTGGLLGIASGGAVGLVALLWLGHGALALCLVLGIGLGVTGAAIIGVAIPNLLRLVTGDPRLAAGPIALAAADMFTLVLYFNLARWLL
jgi:magnesium transporter